MNGWISAEERIPEFPCVICDAHRNPPTVPHGIVIISDEKHGTWAIDGELAWPTLLQKRGRDACLWENRIIYWMPLPKLPEENAYGPEE